MPSLTLHDNLGSLCQIPDEKCKNSFTQFLIAQSQVEMPPLDHAAVSTSRITIDDLGFAASYAM
jgi:hypothetical protein